VFALHQQMAAADPVQAAVIETGDQAAFRANFAAFSQEPGPQADLLGVDVPMLMYCGTTDPWHAPMRDLAGRARASFFSVSDADHAGGWTRSRDVLAQVLPFLTASSAGRSAS
jgi:pimeloyl-ACP methyl ester carboxylesterase